MRLANLATMTSITIFGISLSVLPRASADQAMPQRATVQKSGVLPILEADPLLELMDNTKSSLDAEAQSVIEALSAPELSGAHPASSAAGKCSALLCRTIPAEIAEITEIAGPRHATPPGASPARARQAEGPDVKQVPPALFQGLPSAQVHRVLHEQRGNFRHCYERAATRNPGLVGPTGGLTVAMLVGRDGKVQSVSIPQDSLHDSAVKTCIASLAGHLMFPPPEGGMSTRVDLPLSFQTID